MGAKTYIQLNKFSFSELTTFKTGGNIKHFFEVKSDIEIVEAVKFAKTNNLPIFIIGGGSDILVSDKDFDGMVIKFIGDKILFTDHGSLFTATAQAGAVWDDLVKLCVENNLQGIECLSGIPGTVGGAPIQNLGAYGQELKDTFVSLTAYDIDNEKFVKFNNKECKFGYRTSIFKDKKYWQKFIITEVTLRLDKNNKPTVNYESIKSMIPVNPSLSDVRDAIIQKRSVILEDWEKMPNAGSYFKNPIITDTQKQELEKRFESIKIFPFQNKFKISAGWMIEKAGWKGKSLGLVKVSDLHSLIITNPDGKGTTADILKLANVIQKDVYKMFRIKLEPEVQYIEF